MVGSESNDRLAGAPPPTIDRPLANPDVGVTRLQSNGKPDTSFAPAGTGLFDAGQGVSGFGNGVAVMANGKIVVDGE